MSVVKAVVKFNYVYYVSSSTGDIFSGPNSCQVSRGYYF